MEGTFDGVSQACILLQHTLVIIADTDQHFVLVCGKRNLNFSSLNVYLPLISVACASTVRFSASISVERGGVSHSKKEDTIKGELHCVDSFIPFIAKGIQQFVLLCDEN